MQNIPNINQMSQVRIEACFFIVIRKTLLSSDEHSSNILLIDLGSSERDSPKSEMKRSRSDLLTVILQQLSTSIGNANAVNWNPLSEEVADCTVSLKTNLFDI